MAEQIKAKDAVPGRWYDDEGGIRLLCTYNENHRFIFAKPNGAWSERAPNHTLTPLPDCTGWDWEPAPKHPPIPDGWERVQDGMLKKGDKYCLPGFATWIDACIDISDPIYSAVIIRKIKDTTPDPGEGWRIAEGEDWKDERCELWSDTIKEWTARLKFNVGYEFNPASTYRIPIDPAPEHPPVPEGWEIKPGRKICAGESYWEPGMDEWQKWVVGDYDMNDGEVIIRRIEPTHRPFASAEEFDAEAHRIVVNIGTGTRRRIDHYSDRGCMGMSWDMAFRKYKFLDGTPFGVDVKE